MSIKVQTINSTYNILSMEKIKGNQALLHNYTYYYYYYYYTRKAYSVASLVVEYVFCVNLWLDITFRATMGV